MATAKNLLLSFQATPEQRRKLRLASAQRDLPMSEIIRLSIDEYLKSA
jgi:hypothetical protein